MPYGRFEFLRLLRLHARGASCATVGIMKPFVKYLLFQIPQWLILALFLFVLVNGTVVPAWTASGFLIAWVLKDLAVFPLVRRAYESNAKTGTEALIGAKAVAQERLDPEGYIKISGELWKARADPVDQAIAAGSVVEVREAIAMTLVVRAKTVSDNRDGRLTI